MSEDKKPPMHGSWDAATETNETSVRLVRTCRRCGQQVRKTKSSHQRAHKCPHGQWCTPPYVRRRQGERGGKCADCFQAKQLSLLEKIKVGC